MPRETRTIVGRVDLVGAGPGDPGLITLRGVECLRQADIVFYDYLVNTRILEHAPAEAELVCLGRHGRGRVMTQDEVNERLIAAALAGKTVVRLKGGDPAVFARAADEVEALVSAGVPYVIVPGITAALAAGSYAGVPVTDRRVASALALVTGHEGDAKEHEALDYAALAHFPGTLVFYMGVTSVGAWSEALVAAGKSADTPVAIVRRCTWSDQTTLRATLSTIADTVEQHRLRPPAIFIVGEVARRETDVSWFTGRPLFGRRVVVTRPVGQADSLCDALESEGAEVLVQPAIEISPPDDWRAVDATLASLESYDWIVFSSANGVRSLLDRLMATGGDVRRLANVRLAAIGPGTADLLRDYHLVADLVPDVYRAESLAAALTPDAAGRRFLLARASRGREVLFETLQAAGGQVEQIVVYQSRDVKAPRPEVAEALAAGHIDWVTVTSSAIARSLATLFGEELRRTRLASISPVTSATLRELGFEPAVEAEPYNMAGVVQAIVSASH